MQTARAVVENGVPYATVGIVHNRRKQLQILRRKNNMMIIGKLRATRTLSVRICSKLSNLEVTMRETNS